MEAIVDTTVVIHLLRRYKPALAWFNNNQTYGVTSTTWMEVMQGTTSKSHQTQARGILDQFEMLYLTAADQQWAMEQLEAFQFSHHISMSDCQIAAVVHRLNLPLYTHNLKDMTPIIGKLAVKPYV
ncbi:type II toxin-antitoxin system VapC family toxin [bacterium]|nr:type II toxin-antitoxin system VapC family toxin [bacterium]